MKPHSIQNAFAVALMVLALPALPGRGATNPAQSNYFDNEGRDDVLSGGVRMIPIETPKGTFHVWTKRVGNNPRIKVLLLHGGPGFSHEYLEAFDSYFPAAGIQYYYYDQLGSFFSDQPDEPDLWDTSRFVEEVEAVRKALGLGPDNFYLFGQSWGGLLATEYALKYQQNLKGLIISNMVASIPLYNEYAKNVIFPQMDPAVLAEIKRLEATGNTQDPRYMGLLIPNHYEKHVCRMPAAEWPDPFQRALKHVNEPRRDSRRLHSLRGWGHGTTEQVLPRGSGPGSSDGPGAAGEARIAVGGDYVDRGEDRLHPGDAAQLGTAG